jgi:C-terminal processing protease CtpA/Prc
MSLQNDIKNIIYFFVKKEYNLILKNKNIKIINHVEIDELIDDIYLKKKDDLKLYIRDSLKKKMKESYNGPLIENIIFDIFEDDNLAKERLKIEIINYQNYVINKNNNNLYEVTLIPDKEYGLGLNISIKDYDVIVKSFKKNPDNNSLLPAECSKIKPGDIIYQINDQVLNILSVDKIIKLLKSLNNNKNIKIILNKKINKDNNNINIQSK